MRHGSGFVDSCRIGYDLAFARGEDDDVARDDAWVLLISGRALHDVGVIRSEVPLECMLHPRQQIRSTSYWDSNQIPFQFNPLHQCCAMLDHLIQDLLLAGDGVDEENRLLGWKHARQHIVVKRELGRMTTNVIQIFFDELAG